MHSTFKARLLSVTSVPELGETRRIVLERAGYEVVTCSLEKGVDTLQQSAFDLLLIGHGLKAEAMRELIRHADESRIPVIALRLVESSGRETGGVLYVNVWEGPEKLIEAVREQLAGTGSQSNPQSC